MIRKALPQIIALLQASNADAKEVGASALSDLSEQREFFVVS